MKYGSKTATETLIRAENRFGRVRTVETGLKTGEPSGTAAGSRRREPEPFAPSRAEPRDRLRRCVTRGRSRASHVAR